MKDLPTTIATLKKYLKPEGKLAIFYSSHKKESDTNVDLLAENKPLGKALTANGFKFNSIDFTLNEKRIWEESVIVANELKEEFIQEKNLDLYKGRIAEASKNIKWQNNGLVSRYFYFASLES